MKTVNTENYRRSFAGGGYRERRTGYDRRLLTGRRKMIRFDETGGDRRSVYARRSTDMGFRDEED